MATQDGTYGHRARIGYTSPPLTTEVFPYDFYRIVPDGVTLVLTTLAIVERNKEEVDRSYEISLAAARAMARTGVDLVVLGGVPINLSRGYENADTMLRDLEAELGVKVSSSAAAQSRALKALGATRLVVARAYPAQGDFPFEAHAGCRILGTVTGDAPFAGIPRLPRAYALELGREAMKAYPKAEPIMFPSPHGPHSDAIEPPGP